MTRAELLRQRVVNATEEPEAFYDMLTADVEWDITDTVSPMAGVYHGMKRANVWTFRGDQVVRFKSFSSREAALRDAGIEPPRIDE